MRFDRSALTAAAGALLLHGVVIAGLLWHSAAPLPPAERVQSVRVELVERDAQAVAPAPAPVSTLAPAPGPEAAPAARRRPAPTSDDAAPAADIAPARPALPAAQQSAVPRRTKPAVAIKAARTDPVPPSTAAMEAPPESASESVPEPAARPASRPGPEPEPARIPEAAADPHDRAQPHRTAPRIDANWRGNVPPPYPATARRMGDQGEVRLDVHIGADGAVLEVQLRKSSGSPLLDRAAAETVRQWRFEPATADGQPVAEWYRNWRWVFRLEDDRRR